MRILYYYQYDQVLTNLVFSLTEMAENFLWIYDE